MLKVFEAQKFDNLIKELLKPYTQACIIDGDGEAIHLKYLNIVDIGTLPTVAMQSTKYFPMKTGDIVLTNDPYSGGSTLNHMNLTMALSTRAGTQGADIYFCIRVPFKPRVISAKTVDDEGVRIPPTPIVMDGKINTEILSAIEAHPLAPFRFKDLIMGSIEKMQKTKANYGILTRSLKLQWSKKHIKPYFKISRDRMLNLISQLSIGDCLIEQKLGKGIKLRLKSEITEDKVLFDFSGSTACDEFQVTDSVACGACLGALLSVFTQDIPVNSGTLSAIEVFTPKNSMVNAEYPAPVYKGMTDGASIIANLALKSLGKIDSQKIVATSGASNCAFEIDYGEQNYFYDTLEPGTAATKHFRGENATLLWSRSPFNPKIEEIEQRYPLKILNVSLRSNSGGAGYKKGGDGVTKEILVLKPAILRWSIVEPTENPEGSEGGKTATSSEIYVIRGKEKLYLEKEGSFDLLTNDCVVVASAGGGGYGKEISED